MNRYTILCTPEQTKKALELGAPLEVCNYNEVNTDRCFLNKATVSCYRKPTAEEMCGWLEEIFSEIDICKEGKGWCYDIFYLHKRVRGRSDFDTREEATLAAINAALEYLTNNKRK